MGKERLVTLFQLKTLTKTRFVLIRHSLLMPALHESNERSIMFNCNTQIFMEFVWLCFSTTILITLLSTKDGGIFLILYTNKAF